MAGLGHWYIELEKQGYWRGNQTTWSNRYVMSGADPSASDATNVIGIMQAIESSIEPAIGPNLGWGHVEGRAYGSGGGAPFATVGYNPSKAPGSAFGFDGLAYPSGSGETIGALEDCLLIETPLNGLNSRGKPQYLRKYIRAVRFNTVEGVANAPLAANVIAGINAAVKPWQTGMGTNNWVVIAPSGIQAASAPTVHPYLANHQKPRGRKRKVTSSNPLFQLASDAAKLRSALGDLADAGLDA